MDERERYSNLSSKDKLEQYLIKGQGLGEFKKGERSVYLGELRERILRALTIPQVHEEGTYKEIQDAIKDPRAKKLVLNRKTDLKKAAEYIRLARENNINFTTVEGDNIKSELGLVVASDHAVEVDDILVLTRKQKLTALGFTEELIDNPGQKVCDDCYNKIKELAPEELKNYSPITFFDKLTGVKCKGC